MGFSKVPRGSNIFQGRPTFSRKVHFFSRREGEGGGGAIAYSYGKLETYRTCDFPWGDWDPLSPLWISACY